MRAAVFHGPNQPLKLEDVPTPEPGPGQILVQVAACGVCHTDLHYIDHGVPTAKKPPLILGHEASGTVAKLGDGVKNFQVGDRVLLPAVLSCGTCFFCRTGRENICQSMVMFGNNIDGAYAEYVLAPAKDAFPLPEEVPLVEGAIIADATSTPYFAVTRRAGLRPGDSCLVMGCGGVGMNAVQIAASIGCKVIAVDVLDKKLEYAKSFGAFAVINAKQTQNLAKDVRKLTGGMGVDVAFECIGNPATMEAAFGTIRKGGRLVVVGYTDKPMSLPVMKIMYFEQEVIGSLGCRPVDYPPLIEMARLGKVRVREMVTHRFPLAEINKAFDLLRSGDPSCLRAVVIP
ncbi:MAG: alcohol dehydrogenase catalytic domain-containing protein [Myxococcales bacterium]|nr:alcohol dehydrogenase catalytic domain-containing protein [Myxococcales bacterium]